MRDCCYERDSGTEERDSGNNPLYEPRAGVTADLDPPGPHPLADLDPPLRIWTPPPQLFYISHFFKRTGKQTNDFKIYVSFSFQR